MSNGNLLLSTDGFATLLEDVRLLTYEMPDLKEAWQKLFIRAVAIYQVSKFPVWYINKKMHFCCETCMNAHFGILHVRSLDLIQMRKYCSVGCVKRFVGYEDVASK